VAAAAALGQTISGVESFAKAYRNAPAPASRAALARYAAAHPQDLNGALARFTIGVVALEQKDYASAIDNLTAARTRLPKLADYAGYYLGTARVQSEDFAGAAKDLEEASAAASVPSPLTSRALILEAQALVSGNSPEEAVALLRRRYAELTQPEGANALASAYEAAGEPAQAVAYYQEVYYKYPAAEAAVAAGAALERLKKSAGAAYPPPMPPMMLARADAWMAARDYRRALSEYSSLVDALGGAGRDQARVGEAVASYWTGKNVPQACLSLLSLNLNPSEADAQRLYYVTECGRKLDHDDQMTDAVKRLGELYPESPWRFKALITAANRFVVANEPEKYEPLYKTAAAAFPAEPLAGAAHWRVAWSAYIHRRSNAGRLLKEHLAKFPEHASACAALYFLGRLAEKAGDDAAARAYFNRVTGLFPNFYYAVLARERLTGPKLVAAIPAARVTAYLDGLGLPERRRPIEKPAAAASVRLERARLFRTAGFSDWADAELRFGMRRDAQPVPLAMELARYEDSVPQRLRYLKNAAPDYLAIPIEEASTRFWELLFPLPFQADLRRYAQLQNIDPYLVAGLIRQESEFDPKAVSVAHAYGLTQVRPATARQLARHFGVRRLSDGALFQPSTNLKLGIYYLRVMLDQWGGKWELTLASYNAGQTRVSDWVTWNTYEEPAEFIESIPFTETREYVQAVLRNAAVYRQLYRGRPAPPVAEAAKPTRKPANTPRAVRARPAA
jgi:soluble lytic murein transglycosylase